MKTKTLIMLLNTLKTGEKMLKSNTIISIRFGLTFFLFLSLFLFVLINIAKACVLQPGTYYTDSSCTSPITAYDWKTSLGGCAEGVYAGPLYEYSCGVFGCYCSESETKWNLYPGYNGQICKVRWGITCGLVDGDVFEGRYDASEGKCVECYDKIQIKAVKCGIPEDDSKKCESACGAEEFCDEITYLNLRVDNNKICAYYAALYDKNGNLKGNDYCLYAVCDSSKLCYEYYAITTRLYCIYDNGFKWSISIPSRETSCSDGYDNDCDGLIDCADPDCAGQQGPNGVICCQTSNDCPPDPVNYTLGRCINNICRWPPCSSNSECVPGYCCVNEIIDSNKANQGRCVPKGIYSSKWLCDPPEWNFHQNISTNTSKLQTIFDLILNTLSHFFQR